MLLGEREADAMLESDEYLMRRDQSTQLREVRIEAAHERFGIYFRVAQQRSGGRDRPPGANLDCEGPTIAVSHIERR